jgi:rubredoxin
VVPKKGAQSLDEEGEREEEVSVDITCPNCNFSKNIPKEKIPAGARWTTCPQCKHRFEFDLTGPVFDFEKEGEGAGGKDQVGQERTPWENRSELGIWQGIYQTFKAVLFSPEKLFRTMSFKGGIKEPLAFGLLLGSIGAMLGLFWNFLMMSGSLLEMVHELMGPFNITLVFLGLLIFSPLFVIIILFVTSGILHLSLLIVRGGKNGFEATFRVISYSQAIQVLGLIPFIGGLIGGLWVLVVQVIGIREIHETSYLRVFIAFLIPLALIFLVVMAGVILFFVFGYQILGQI